MDCKDLMVGDWVSYKDDPPYIVHGTSICKVVTIDNGIDHRNVMDDAINPIPLTEDILVKNGFYRSPRWHYCETTTDDGFKIYVQLGCGGTIDYVRITKHNSNLMERDLDATVSIHYVHELQHLLRLVGIKKEIEL